MDDQLSAAERRALDAWVPIEPPADFADRVLDAREIDSARRDTGRRDDRRVGLRVAAVIAACVAVAAIVALVVTRRGADEERLTPVVEPAARPPGPPPAPVASTGIRVESALPFEVRALYATTWVAMDPGVREVAAGSSLRFSGAPAQVTAWETTIEIQSAAEVQIDAPTNFHLETGSIAVSARALVSVGVRGGSVMLFGPGEVELDAVLARTTVSSVFGGVRVLGKNSQHDAAVGEVVDLNEWGRVTVTDSPPTEVDVAVASSDSSITIHDPRPPTAVQFRIGATCPTTGIVELAQDGPFLVQQRSGGGTFANLLVGQGHWRYRVRCVTSGAIGAPVDEGRITVLRDPGTRALPPNQPAVNRIDTDGRNYRITYNSVIPTIEFRAKGQGSRFTLHLARDTTEELFESSLPAVIVPGTKLRDGQYTYWFETDGAKDATVSKLTIDPEAMAPQLRLDSPINGSFARTPVQSPPIAIRGSAAPGWALSFDGIQLPVDGQGRFSATAGALSTHAFALRAEHATRGIHYYLRRPR